MDPTDAYDAEIDSELKPAGLAQPLVLLAVTLVVALWLAKRHAGLDNPLWSYLTFAIASTGIGMLLISLWYRNDWPGIAAKVLGTAIGLVCVVHVLRLGVDGKEDLRASNIGVYAQLAPGVITCVREHFETPGRYRFTPIKQLGWDEIYAYIVDGKVYHQLDFAPKPYFPIGTPVRIIYDTREPERARLVTPEDILPAEAVSPVPADIQALLPKPDPTHIAC
jgi:hypothetical protein